MPNQAARLGYGLIILGLLAATTTSLVTSMAANYQRIEKSAGDTTDVQGLQRNRADLGLGHRITIHCGRISAIIQKTCSN